MWPHHPRARALLQMAADGSLGTLHTGRSSFSYPMDMSSGDHRIDTRGAGALFDIGIYCIAPFLLIADRDPVGMAATATRNDLGVDIVMAGWIDWGEWLQFDVRRQLRRAGSQADGADLGEQRPGERSRRPRAGSAPSQPDRHRTPRRLGRDHRMRRSERLRRDGRSFRGGPVVRGPSRRRSRPTRRACAWRRSSTSCTNLASPAALNQIERPAALQYSSFSRRL